MTSEDDTLLAAESLIDTDITKEVAASTLLAETTQASAELLAETTKSSAKLLAKTTAHSADELSKSNAISVRWMQWMTIALLVVGFIQIVVAVIPLIASGSLK
jgi:hypothetical protein